MVLLAQIEAKLGPVTEDVRTRVNAATPAEQIAWATRILTAATLADVFDAPAAAPAVGPPAGHARCPEVPLHPGSIEPISPLILRRTSREEMEREVLEAAALRWIRVVRPPG